MGQASPTNVPTPQQWESAINATTSYVEGLGYSPAAAQQIANGVATALQPYAQQGQLQSGLQPVAVALQAALTQNQSLPTDATAQNQALPTVELDAQQTTDDDVGLLIVEKFLQYVGPALLA